MTRGPARMPLTGRQAEALTHAADGSSLSEVADRMGVTRERVSTLLSEAYTRLGVAWLPREQKRSAAVREARRRGLIPQAAYTSDGPTLAEDIAADRIWDLRKAGE